MFANESLHQLKRTIRSILNKTNVYISWFILKKQADSKDLEASKNILNNKYMKTTSKYTL